jgi:hypothetical protein
MFHDAALTAPECGCQALRFPWSLHFENGNAARCLLRKRIFAWACNATLFMTAAILTSSRGLAVILLWLVYGAITFHPTNVFAVCLEVAEKRS